MLDRSKQQSKLEFTAFSGVLDNLSYAAPKLWKVRYDSNLDSHLQVRRAGGESVARSCFGSRMIDSSQTRERIGSDQLEDGCFVGSAD